MNRTLRILALLGAIAVALVAVFGGKLKAFQHQHAPAAQAPKQQGERKVLYWYDAMNPQHHSDKPGKAPDGMDLVPMYAEGAAPLVNKAVRKILYWYDPMHPQYKSDNPGKAPDCGMDLVPKYADEQPAQMAPGSVMISADKQQLIGVRTAEVKREALTRDLRTT